MNDDDILWETRYQDILDFKVSAHVKKKCSAIYKINTIRDAPQIFNWYKIRYLHLKHILSITAYLCLIFFFFRLRTDLKPAIDLSASTVVDVSV